jgi:hypothetical protein
LRAGVFFSEFKLSRFAVRELVRGGEREAGDVSTS